MPRSMRDRYPRRGGPPGARIETKDGGHERNHRPGRHRPPADRPGRHRTGRHPPRRRPSSPQATPDPASTARVPPPHLTRPAPGGAARRRRVPGVWAAPASGAPSRGRAAPAVRGLPYGQPCRPARHPPTASSRHTASRRRTASRRHTASLATAAAPLRCQPVCGAGCRRGTGAQRERHRADHHRPAPQRPVLQPPHPPALIFGIVGLSKQSTDPEGSARMTRYGWIAFGVGLLVAPRDHRLLRIRRGGRLRRPRPLRRLLTD